MSRVRVVSYVVNPFNGARQPLAALLSDGAGVQVVRASLQNLPVAARANAEWALRDLEAAPALDVLPVGVGAHVVAGEIHTLPPDISDPRAWVQAVLLAA